MSAQTAAAQRKYKTYSNARFGYSVSYPSDLLTPQGEAENGDGQIFTGSGAEMRVYGSNLLLNETLRREYNALLKEKGGSVTYKTITANFFVVSGRADGKIFYRKTMKNADGAFLTFMIEYDETERATYDAVVTRIVKSFK
ncbi:MAG: hypothetical protein JSS81_11455 [Acidobacteria bacterium]|nr:hypothetical protein [Acidobacteriota bacterium]